MVSNLINFVSNKADLGDSLTEKFDALFPTWTTILTTLLALTIISFVLGPMVYKSVKKMVEKRQKYIQDNINSAENLNNSALLEREKAKREITKAREIAAEIISNAKFAAEEIKTSNLAAAKDEANQIVSLAKIDIQREKEIFEIESKKEIIVVAMAAAKKIIKQEINKNTSKKIIEEFIKDK